MYSSHIGVKTEELYCDGWSVESPQQEAFIARKINFFSWCYKKQTNPMETALLKTPITRSEEEEEGPSDADHSTQYTGTMR